MEYKSGLSLYFLLVKYNPNIEIIKEFVHRGFSINVIDSFNKTVIDYAKKYNKDIYGFLKSVGGIDKISKKKL